MIEPTDEMIADARDASAALTGHCSTYLETKASIRAALAIVARDYDIRPRPRPDARCSRPGCGHVAGQHRDSCVGDLMFCPCPKFVRDPEPGQPEPAWHVGCTWCWRTAWHREAR